MVPHLFEILVILAIIVLVFGVGKVKNIGAALGRSGKEFKKALSGEEAVAADPDAEPIDITPRGERESPSHEPKPGTKVQPVDDAELVDDQA